MVACVEGSVVGFVGWRERGEWRDSGYLSWHTSILHTIDKGLEIGS